MSNRKKLPKKKETTDYTLEDFVEDESQKWADYVDSVRVEAAREGKYGVMVINTEKAFVCDLVPLGRIMVAGSQEAVDKMRARKELGE